MAFKSNINSLTRIQTSENRDVKNGVLLDRNERVESFDDKTYKSIFKNISKFSLNATPDIQDLYKKISKFFRYKKRKHLYRTRHNRVNVTYNFLIIKKNEEVVVLDPTYPMYEVLCKLHGVKIKKWKFNNNLSLEFDDLKKIITRKTRVIFLVNPNLPIEFEFEKSLKKQIYKFCLKKRYCTCI